MKNESKKRFFLGQLPEKLVDIDTREVYRLVEVPNGHVYFFNNVLDALCFANKYSDCCEFKLEIVSSSVKTYVL